MLKQVLIAEDKFDISANLESILNKLGFESVTVCDGVRAIETFLVNQDFDLVFLEVCMPKLNGYDVFQKIRKLKPTLRVILCGQLKVDSESLAATGLTGVLNDTIPITEEAVQKVIERRRVQR